MRQRWAEHFVTVDRVKHLKVLCGEAQVCPAPGSHPQLHGRLLWVELVLKRCPPPRSENHCQKPAIATGSGQHSEYMSVLGGAEVEEVA